jgi:hypothetical protein
MQVLRLLRNTTAYQSLESAKTALNGLSLQNGEMVIATYTENNENKTIFAIKNLDTISIFDNQGGQIGEITADNVSATPIPASEETVSVTGDNLADQIASLAQTIKSIEGTGVDYGNGLEVDSGTGKLQVKLDTVSGDNALTLSSDGLYIPEMSTFDCGTY